jgi:hypothetical protein
MDSLIKAAACALAAGDPLGALNRVALRDDAPGLALRGVAMAQLDSNLGDDMVLNKISPMITEYQRLARLRPRHLPTLHARFYAGKIQCALRDLYRDLM